jgi:hypothetical protein
LEPAGFFVEVRRKAVCSVFAPASAKDVELLEQQNTRFYPPNRGDVFIPYVAFGIYAQAFRLKLPELLA